MPEESASFDDLFKRISEFGLTYAELVKLKAVNKASEVVSSAFPDLIIIILAVFFILFFNLGLAIWVGYLLGKTYLGFLITAAFYLVLGCIIHLFLRGWIKKVVANYFIRLLLR